MSYIKTISKQISHYAIGHGFVMMASLFSFPVLTRIFTVGDYGTLSLLTTTMFIATAIIKLGFPASIVRYYAEYKFENKLESFYSTIFLSITGISCAVCFVCILAILLLQNIFHHNYVFNLIIIVSLLIFSGCISDILTSFMRAEQKTRLYNLLVIVRRYTTLAVGILFAVYVVKGLEGYLLGQLLASLIVLFFLIIISMKKINKSKLFSRNIFRKSFNYGFPLVWGEFGHLILNYVDRYLIAFFLGSAPLGLYTAGYNLATYLTEVLICPINYAITPVYMSILVNKGEKETKEFFTKMFRYFLLIIFPVMLGFIATGKEVIAVMASKKYLESYSIMTIIVVGQAIYASTLILNNGLFIKNKTYIYRNIMLFTCLLNIALNTILIPKYGILGSAFATLISYAIYSIVITYYAFKEFSFKIEWHSTIIYAGSSLIMFVTVKCISIASLLLHIFSQITIGALVYISIVVLLDKALRRNLLLFLARLRSRHT